MILAGLNVIEVIGSVLAFFFTLVVLLYAFGDNTLFRFVIHIFIGTAAGYAAAVAIHSVVLPRISTLMATGEGVAPRITEFIIVVVLAGLLLLKASPRTAVLGNPVGAFLVGVGAAAAIGGAIQGTIFPQAVSATNVFNLANAGGSGGLLRSVGLLGEGIVTLIGTTASLAYFHFGARKRPNQPSQRNRLVSLIGWVGHIFIAITFGVIFAGVYTSALTALINRFYSLWDLVGFFIQS